MCHVRECVGGMLPSGRHTLGAELLCSGKVPGEDLPLASADAPTQFEVIAELATVRSEGMAEVFEAARTPGWLAVKVIFGNIRTKLRVRILF